MIDIINEITAYLLTKITPYSMIYLNAFLGASTDEIIIRTEPSSAVEQRHLDGSRMGSFNFSFYSKSVDTDEASGQIKASNQLEEIVRALDLAEMAEITDGLCVSIKAVTLPVFISKSEAGEYIFSASFRLEYLNERA
jgi:hypothetical protein